ncbi:solute carrier organic anion transporter family member 74D [Drosophila subpulchrella]|uniref:solute carrier organic anion transporter family member 74D n=1 Tax=Drosophila subpulchrella TaxID=1486046 RepID=UPI0018A1986E|nr:solute carrier organic anion transporter family member 74D [Drosophila subpulchrella]XP_037720036.1 solute carrier organic anion transporter family member 74D [Drosophila subpulchrella]
MTKSNGDVEAATQVQSLGGKPSNGHGPLNGNGYHQNGGRRDSSQAFTPLLSQHNNGTATNNGEVTTLPPSTVLYESTPSNNNEWKAPEDLGQLKNGLGNLLSSNNNGTGNGHSLSEKYAHEQAPLTGNYKLPPRSSESEESDFDSDLNGSSSAESSSSCGLFGCRPRWARRFASTHVFMVVFLLAYILQGMYMTYFVSVITTIEKLFQIKSKTTGILLSASEMGQICTAMLLTYFAGRGHRPRWIACGMVLFSIAAFSCALPHFIFGEQLMHSSVILQQPQSSSSLWQANPNLCTLGGNETLSGSECNEERQLEQASHSKITVIVLCIFFGSLLSSGIGQTAVATLGIPYIDDNVGSKQSPMYMAVTIGMRILGPASGFIFGSFCTRWYVNFSNPGFDATDPRWIGAWWLGPVAIGSLMLLASIAMFSFPKQLRGKQQAQGQAATPAAPVEPEEKPKLKDFPKTVRRQLSNDILMFRTASCVFHLLPIAGLYTFLPKYLETQFRLATYDANMIAAFCGILVMGIGIVISGLFILKRKPTARGVAAWIAFTALVYSAGMIILMFIGCSMNDFAGYKPSDGNSPALIEPTCSAALNCTCDKENFAPICADGKMYISACHAGCSSSSLRPSDNRTLYSDCACIPDAPEAVNGYCDNDCKNFIYFILIFAICVFMHSTSEVGSMLLVMRCTHPKDKAMAMGVIQSAIGLFGNVPCPIIYGAVVDSACLIWKSVCGKHGACSLYDADTFRQYFLGITAGIMFLAFLMDLVVWRKAHRIDIAPEDPQEGGPTPNGRSLEASESKQPITPAPDTTV